MTSYHVKQLIDCSLTRQSTIKEVDVWQRLLFYSIKSGCFWAMIRWSFECIYFIKMSVNQFKLVKTFSIICRTTMRFPAQQLFVIFNEGILISWNKNSVTHRHWYIHKDNVTSSTSWTKSHLWNLIIWHGSLVWIFHMQAIRFIGRFSFLALRETNYEPLIGIQWATGDGSRSWNLIVCRSRDYRYAIGDESFVYALPIGSI